VDHLKANGFATEVTNLPDLSEIQAKYNVPAAARSCHTAVVGNYVVEGHVPAATIHRFLKEKPAVLGIAAPGMPNGSPGMDIPGSPAYDVVTFDKAGQLKHYSKEGK
jgi:hypothetical protein